MTHAFKKVTALLLGLTMLGGTFGGAFLAFNDGGTPTRAVEGYDWDFTNGFSEKNQSYDTKWIQNDLVVVQGNNNNGDWAYVRVGGKTTTTRTMVSLTASPVAIESVNLLAKNITSNASNGIMSAVTLEVAATITGSGTSTDLDESTIIDTVSGVTVSTDMLFEPTSGTSWDAGSYFRLSFSWTATKSSNAGMDVQKVLFNSSVPAATLESLTVTPTDEVYYTTDVLSAETYTVSGTKSDGTQITDSDYTVAIGTKTGTDFTKRADVIWGETHPAVEDNNIRFTSKIANATGEYPFADVEISVEAPELTNLTISGDMTRKSYITGDSWDNTGLTVTGTFDVGGTADLTNEVQWTYSPSAPALGVEQVIVTAKYGEASASTTINGIQVFDYVKDTITVEDTGVTGAGSYTGFEGVQGTTAVYAGDIARNNANSSGQYAIQMNNTVTRGIWSTTSGGTIRGIEVEWADNTNPSRTLRVYGSNSDASSTSGMTQIGTLGYGETFLMLDAEHNYTQVHVNASGAAYLLSITFIWEPLPDAELESITLSGTLTNTNYLSTDTAWNAEGLTLTLNYSDGNTTTLTSGLNLTWNPVSPSEATTGDTTVTVSATHEGLTSNELTLDVYVEAGPTYILDVVDESTSLEASTSSGSFVTDGGVDWHYYTTGGLYVTREGGANGRGLQFGTKSTPCTDVVLYSDIFAASTGETLIRRVNVTAATAADGNNKVTLTVKVNGEEVGNTLLTSSNATYTFDLDTPMYGSVELVYSNPANSAVYFRGIDVFADTHETMTAEVVAAVNGLLDFRTCEIDATSVEFGTWLDANKTIIEENRVVLANLVAHDYESMDTTYSGNKTSIVNVLAKYDACVARYETSTGALAPTFFGNEDTTIAVVVVIITLSAITALVGFYYYDKRRRVNK